MDIYTVESLEEGSHDPMTFRAESPKDAVESWAETFSEDRFRTFAEDEGYEDDQMGEFTWDVEVWVGASNERPGSVLFGETNGISTFRIRPLADENDWCVEEA